MDSAGLGVSGDTGSAIRGVSGALKFHLSAFEPDGDPGTLRQVVTGEGYEEIPGVGGRVAVFGDGHRFAWQIHGLWVYIAPVGISGGTPAGTYGEIRMHVLHDLVRASVATPYRP